VTIGTSGEDVKTGDVDKAHQRIVKAADEYLNI